MKIVKRIICLLLVVVILAFISYMIFVISSKHNQPTDPVEKDIQTIKNVVNIFEDELTKLGVDEQMINDVINEIEEYNKETNYVIAFNVKNETNPIVNLSVHLPVDEIFFYSVEIGDVITEDKVSSFEDLKQFLNGWIITVKDKIEREE